MDEKTALIAEWNQFQNIDETNFKLTIMCVPDWLRIHCDIIVHILFMKIVSALFLFEIF